MELRINIHARKDDFLLYVNGEEKSISYDTIRKSYYVYTDVKDTNTFDIKIKNKPIYPMSIFRHLCSIIFLFWLFLILEISGFGKDGKDWKKGISLYTYEACFKVNQLKDKEVNIRYDGNYYDKGIWLKPRFVIADEADLQLQYQMNIDALKQGYQKYWLFFGALNMCLFVLIAIFIYASTLGWFNITTSLILAVVLIIVFVLFMMNNYHIYKDYLHHKALVQVDGEQIQYYKESFH